MTLLEPGVALSDFALALECAVFAALIHAHGGHGNPLRLWFSVLLTALGVAALMGGISHGFIADQRSIIYSLIWITTLLAIGIAAWSGWAIGARLILSNKAAYWIMGAATLVLAIYVLVIIFVTRDFAVAIIHYLPAAVFLFIAFAIAYRRTRQQHLRMALYAIALMFVAVGVQQAQIGLHEQYFDHNALYHLIQGVAVFLLYWSVRRLIY